MHGKGEMTYEDGRTYKGSYYKDAKDGFGVYTWPNGKIYEGEWYKDKQHGKGKFTSSKGQTRLGLWKKGQRIKWIKQDGQTDSSYKDGMSMSMGSMEASRY